MNNILLAIKYILTLMWKKQKKLLFAGALRSLKYLQGPWHVCQISTIPLLCDVTCQHHWQLSRCEDQGRKMNHIITCDSRSLCSVGCVWQSAQWLVEQMSECHVRAAAALSVLGLSCHKCFLYSELHDVYVCVCCRARVLTVIISPYITLLLIPFHVDSISNTTAVLFTWLIFFFSTLTFICKLPCCIAL